VYVLFRGGVFFRGEKVEKLLPAASGQYKGTKEKRAQNRALPSNRES
jgi:hypothetical protein